MVRFVGVDFSGDHRKWAPKASRPSVWISVAELENGRLNVAQICPVQALPGSGGTMDRLARFLGSPSVCLGGIDAPFGIPDGVHHRHGPALWHETDALRRNGQPFCRAPTFLAHLAPGIPMPGRKTYRDTERHWIRNGVAVRSTTWWKPRGGAPFTAACMTLLARHQGSVWPFDPAPSPTLPGPTLCEAFPAAQLRQWSLPHTRYSREPTLRRQILNTLCRDHALRLGSEQRELCEEIPDALDAVICLYAGLAVRSCRLAVLPSRSAATEGWIAVHA